MFNDRLADNTQRPKLFEHMVVDRRGVAAMEFAIVGLFMIALLLPISDVASAAITSMRAYQAMRDVAAYAQYNPPPDVTSPATWPNLPSSMPGYSVTPQSTITAPSPSVPGSTLAINITVLCGAPPGGPCLSASTTPKWFYLTANLQFTPMYLRSLTGGVISYSERFQ
jgi:Flp pilus assembly protein TadG